MTRRRVPEQHRTTVAAKAIVLPPSPHAVSARQRLSELVVQPEPHQAFGRVLDRALAAEALLADNECVHGGLPVDAKAQPGCHPGCPGYPTTGEVIELPTPKPDPDPIVAVAACDDGAVPAVRRLPASNGRLLTSADGVQSIECRCGSVWTRPQIRGRVPKCPTCRADSAA